MIPEKKVELNSFDERENQIFWDLLDELPKEMQMKITHLISDDDLKFFQGALGVMLLAAIHSHKTNDDLKSLKDELAETKVFLSKMTQELDDARTDIAMIPEVAAAGLRAGLSSFGAGIQKTLGSSLGAVFAPALENAFSTAKGKYTSQSLLLAAGACLLLFVSGIAIGVIGTVLLVR